MSSLRQASEEQLVTQLKKKEQYEKATEPIFSTEAGFIVLTFDDGPSSHTPRILEILAQKDVKAVFFLVGENVVKFPKVAREIFEQGHVIGNHSYSHAYFTKLSEDAQVKEITRTSNLIADKIGVGPRYFRPPYGAYNEMTLGLVLKEKMKTVMWSADPKDYVFNTGNAVYKATDSVIASRKILLLHDLKQATVDALPAIIDDIRTKQLSITDEFEK